MASGQVGRARSSRSRGSSRRGAAWVFCLGQVPWPTGWRQNRPCRTGWGRPREDGMQRFPRPDWRNGIPGSARPSRRHAGNAMDDLWRRRHDPRVRRSGRNETAWSIATGLNYRGPRAGLPLGRLASAPGRDHLPQPLFELCAPVGFGNDRTAGERIGQHAGNVVSGAEHERNVARLQPRRHIP